MIEVGEYVRSLINGNIFKVIEVSDLLKEPGIKYYKFDKFRGMCSTEEYNTKHSKNIIDLIEVGDYVNGYEVHKYNGNLGIISINELGWTFIAFKDGIYPIEFVVTKEQFASMEYKVKEE